MQSSGRWSIRRFGNRSLVPPVLLSSFLGVACSGTAVFDSPNPDGCDTGHGCPVVTCACADQTLVIDSTCELGKCVEADLICADRCTERGGVTTLAASETDILSSPTCPTLCDRMYVNDCNIGCELFASECRAAEAVCGVEAAAFWDCVAGRGVFACEDGALTVKGCADLPIAYCGAAPSP